VKKVGRALDPNIKGFEKSREELLSYQGAGVQLDKGEGRVVAPSKEKRQSTRGVDTPPRGGVRGNQPCVGSRNRKREKKERGWRGSLRRDSIA